MSCPTHIKAIRKEILDGLSIMQVAVAVESGRACALELKGKSNQYRGWDEASFEAYAFHLRTLPRRIRKALPFLDGERSKLLTVSFENRVPRGKHLRTPKSFYCVPKRGCSPREPGAVFEVGDFRDLRACLGNRLLKPTWPSVDSFIAEARRVLDEFERRGEVDFTLKHAEVEALVLEIVSEYNEFWPIRAETDPDETTRLVAPGIEEHRPLRGVPKDELAERVEDLDPVVRPRQIEAAEYTLLQSGKLAIEHHHWRNSGHLGLVDDGTLHPCYVLGPNATTTSKPEAKPAVHAGEPAVVPAAKPNTPIKVFADEQIVTPKAETEPSVLAREGEWSQPMSKAEMARRITGRPNARPREVHSMLTRAGLEYVEGYKWRVRLDVLDQNTRRKLEKSQFFSANLSQVRPV